jgi:dUTPase
VKLNILNNKGIVNKPFNKGDAGYDLVAVSPPRVIGSIYQGLHYTAISHIEYDTEVVLSPELINDDYEFYMLLYPRSSIIKTNLVLANSVGVIDSGYTGTIKVCFKYISQPEDLRIIEGKSIRGKKANGILTSINPQRIYEEGDKIAQLIPCKHNKIDINYVNEINSTQRNSGGFGSTGS